MPGRLDLGRVENIGVGIGELERIKLEVGDVLVVEGNGSIEQIGRSAVWRGEIEPCVHQNHIIKVRPAERELSDYIQLWLQSPQGRRELERLASSTSGLHTLSIGKIEEVRCPLPSSSEIAAITNKVAELIATYRDASVDRDLVASDAATLRQSILAAAFRGDLVQ